ncbi:hypothetical protein J437_LFUL005266 [Ladona fulva]|uniref:RanBP2-type domain-containing protein n=1 Tax=Ladona fulva TaxID=123851 RepID=A0A8K0K017_LADFU|nr:hypothetical protein J437_LFUL005266 [Ladona fulva]
MSLNNNGAGATTSTYSSDLQKQTEEEDYCSSVSLKRQREDSCDMSVSSKRRRSVELYISIPKKQPVLSGDESVYSIQGWETELCQDTPDTSTDSSGDLDSERDGPALEFEVASLSSVMENPFGRIRCGSSGNPFCRIRYGSSDTSTDSDDNIKLIGMVVEVKEDKAFWGDDSNTEFNASYSDQEIPRGDYWTCLRCKCLNKPIHRFCSKCCMVRKTWFPPRPRRKRRKNNNGLPRKWNKLDTNRNKPCMQSDSECLSSMESMEYSVNTNSERVKSLFYSERTKESKDDAQTADVVSALNNDMCITCMERPKNAVFVHGSIGHLCCCYQCAKKVWSSSGKCPVCSRKTNSVVKTFLA